MNLLALGRVGVWLVVTIWCCVPFFWMLFMFATSKSQGSSSAETPIRQSAPTSRHSDDGLVANILGSLVMLSLFLYGMWCTVGIVMGFGIDRAMTVVHALYIELFKGGGSG